MVAATAVQLTVDCEAHGRISAQAYTHSSSGLHAQLQLCSAASASSDSAGACLCSAYERKLDGHDGARHSHLQRKQSAKSLNRACLASNGHQQIWLAQMLLCCSIKSTAVQEAVQHTSCGSASSISLFVRNCLQAFSRIVWLANVWPASSS